MKIHDLGQFDQLVLLAIDRIQPESYGVGIHEEIKRSTGRTYSVSGVYAVIYRMEALGFLRRHMIPALQIPGGQARRCYSLTKAGRHALNRSLQLIENLR